MATTGVVNGTNLALYIDESGTLKKLANLVSNDFNASFTMIDVTSKSASGWKEFIPGDKTVTCSFEGLLEDDASVGASEKSFEDLYDLAAAGTSFTVVYTTAVTGDDKYSATAYISELKQSAPYNDAAKISGTIQITGAVTKANNS